MFTYGLSGKEKVSAFITYVGLVAYEPLHAALSPEHSEDKTYVELRVILLQQLNPKKARNGSQT